MDYIIKIVVGFSSKDAILQLYNEVLHQPVWTTDPVILRSYTMGTKDLVIDYVAKFNSMLLEGLGKLMNQDRLVIIWTQRI
jgi:hypothetical protein